MKLQSHDTPPKAVPASKEGQGSYALRLARGDQLTAEEWKQVNESLKFVRALMVRVEYKWPWGDGAEYLYRALIRALGLEHREEELLRLAKSKSSRKQERERELAARMSALGVNIFERNGAKEVEFDPGTGARVVQAIYPSMWPETERARKLIRGREGEITISELHKVFRGTTLFTWADQEDWKDMIEEFGKPKGKVASAKAITKVIIRRRTGLSDATIKTYVLRDFKP